MRLRDNIISCRAICYLLLGFNIVFSQPNKSSNFAQKSVVKCRDARGGNDRLEKIQSLLLNVRFKRFFKEYAESGKIEIAFVLPDKYKEERVTDLAGNVDKFTYITAIDSGRSWIDVRSSTPIVGMSREEIIKQGEKAFPGIYQTFARLTLALLVRTPQSNRTKYRYMGELKTPDGIAYKINVNEERDIANLMLDKVNHSLLMVSYFEEIPQSAGKTVTIENKPGGRVLKNGNDKATSGPKTVKAEVQLRLSDYRPVGEIILPHKILKVVNNVNQEEWIVESYKINPVLNSEVFQKKK